MNTQTANSAGTYRARAVESKGFDSKFNMRDTWRAVVFWTDEHGAESEAWSGASYYQTPCGAGRRSAQAVANKECGVLRAYLRDTGQRREIVQRAARKLENEKRQRREQRAKRIRESMPALLKQHESAIDLGVALIADHILGGVLDLPRANTHPADVQTLREAIARYIAQSTTERVDANYNPEGVAQ